jgi:hypothetical protein
VNNGSITVLDVIDWEELILEAQTDPCGVENSEAFSQIYIELCGYMDTLSKNWLETHDLSEAYDGAFIAVGWALIIKQLHKFKIPNDDSTGICLALRAWIGKCCSREWNRRQHELMGTPPDPAATNHLLGTIQTSCPSPEEGLCESDNDCPDTADRILMRKILCEQLREMPESMRDAILETMDIKDISNLDARGKQGEAAAIAEKHGHKPNAVKTRIHRLKEKVKERFDKERSQ